MRVIRNDRNDCPIYHVYRARVAMLRGEKGSYRS